MAERRVYGKDGVWIVAETNDGPVIAAFYALDEAPGWWRGHAWGRVKQLFLPGKEPRDVAASFLRKSG